MDSYKDADLVEKQIKGKRRRGLFVDYTLGWKTRFADLLRRYLNTEPKYMLDYAVETAFRADTRRLPNGQQLKLALNVALSVGESWFWKGFTRGHHRKSGLIYPAAQPAKPSGPKKGRHPIPAMNSRPPR